MSADPIEIEKPRRTYKRRTETVPQPLRALLLEEPAPPAPIAAVHAPCEGCRHQARCHEGPEPLGCAALVLFRHANSGDPARWSLAPRHPSREFYERATAPKTKTKVKALPPFRRSIETEEAPDPAEAAGADLSVQLWGYDGALY